MLVGPVVAVVDFSGMVTDYADRIAGALGLRDVEDLRSMGPGTVEGMLVARNVQILPII